MGSAMWSLAAGLRVSECCLQSSRPSGPWSSLDELLSILFQSKNNRPLRTGQIYAQDENATHTQLYTSHFDLMKMTAGKRSPPIKPLCVQALARESAAVLNERRGGGRFPPQVFPLSSNCCLFLCCRLGMNPFQKNPKHASVLAERYVWGGGTFFTI
jgi:hypothetical protein